MKSAELIKELAKKSHLFTLPSRMNTPAPSIDEIFRDNQVALNKVRNLNADSGIGSITFVTGATGGGKTALIDLLADDISSNNLESNRDIVRYCNQSGSPYFNFVKENSSSPFFSKHYSADPPISTSSIMVIDEMHSDVELRAAIDLAKNGYRVFTTLFTDSAENALDVMNLLLSLQPKLYELAILDLISINKIVIHRGSRDASIETFPRQSAVTRAIKTTNY